LIVFEYSLFYSTIIIQLSSLSFSNVILPLAFLLVILLSPFLLPPSFKTTFLPVPFVEVFTVVLVLSLPFPKPLSPVAYLVTATGPVLLTEALTFVFVHEALEDVAIRILVETLPIYFPFVNATLLPPFDSLVVVENGQARVTFQLHVSIEVTYPEFANCIHFRVKF